VFDRREEFVDAVLADPPLAQPLASQVEQLRVSALGVVGPVALASQPRQVGVETVARCRVERIAGRLPRQVEQRMVRRDDAVDQARDQRLEADDIGE